MVVTLAGLGHPIEPFGVVERLRRSRTVDRGDGGVPLRGVEPKCHASVVQLQPGQGLHFVAAERGGGLGRLGDGPELHGIARRERRPAVGREEHGRTIVAARVNE